MEPLQVLFDDVASSWTLPEKLAKLYGEFGLGDDTVFANFVASIDGVTAIPDEKRSSALISQGGEADRLVMGLLRAAADVVVVGAGTLRSHPRSSWTSKEASPDHAAEFAELRRTTGRDDDEPHLAVVTASGRVDPAHPALARATIVTTVEGAGAIRDRVSPDALVVAAEDEEIPSQAVLDALRARGHRRVLVEGGPHLLGGFVRDRVVDELFMTVSPLLAGRTKDRPRPGLIDGVELLPGSPADARLLSVREHDSFLLLRYALS